MTTPLNEVTPIAEDEAPDMQVEHDSFSPDELLPKPLPPSIAMGEPPIEEAPADAMMADTSVALTAEGAGIDPATINRHNSEDVFRLLDAAFKQRGEVRKEAVKQILLNANLAPVDKLRISQQLTELGFQENALQSSQDVQRAFGYINAMKEDALIQREGVLEEQADNVELGTTPHGRGIQRASANVQSGKQAVGLARTKVALTSTKVYDEALALSKYVDKKSELAYIMSPMEDHGVKTRAEYAKLELKTLKDVGHLFVPVIGTVQMETQALAQMADTAGIPALSEMVRKWGLTGNSGGGIRAGQAAFNIGQFERDLSAVVEKLPPDQQLQLIRHAKQYVDKAGVQKATMGNGFIEQSIVEKLIGTLLVDDAHKETRSDIVVKRLMQHFETGVGWLELTPVGALVGGAVKTTARAAKGALKAFTGTSEFVRMSKLAPETMAKGVAKVVQGGEQAAKAAGVEDIGDVLRTTLPTDHVSLQGSNIQLNSLDAMKANIDASQGQIMDSITRLLSVNVTNLNPDRAAAGLAQRMTRFNMVNRQDLSTVTAPIVFTEEGATISGLYGKSQQEGYSSLDELRLATSRMFGTDEDGAVKLAVRHKDSGTIIRQGEEGFDDAADDIAAVPELAKEWEWYAQIDQKIPVNDLVNWNELLDPTFITTKTHKPVPEAKGIVGRTKARLNAASISPIMQKLQRNLNSAYSTWKSDVGGVFKNAEGAQRVAQDLIQHLYAPELTKLSKEEVFNLNKAIQRGQHKPSHWTDAELADMGLVSDVSKAAYYAYRKATHFMWNVANVQSSSSMAREDFFHVFGPDGVRIGFGRPLKKASELRKEELDVGGVHVRVVDDSGESVAYMPLAKIHESLDPSVGDALYSMRKADLLDDGTEVAYTLVKKGSLERLTRPVRSGDDVLGYVPGYHTEAVSANIGLEATTKSGRKYLLGTAETAAQARAGLAELLSSSKVTKMYGTDIQAIDMPGVADYVNSAARSRDMYENWGGRVFGEKTRGTITDFANKEAPANFEAPVEATIKSWMALAGTYTKGKQIQHTERALAKHARDAGILRDPSIVKVMDESDLITMKEAKSDVQRKAISNAYSTLSFIRGYSLLPDPATVMQARIARSLGTNVSRLLGDGGALESSLRESARTGSSDILGWVTKLNYFRKIRSDPFNARILQTMQALANAGTPVNFARSIVAKDAFLTVMGNTLDAMRGGKSWDDAYKSLDKTTVRAAARMAGFKMDEFRKLARAYAESGTWHRVSHNDVQGLGDLSPAQRSALTVGTSEKGSKAGSVAAWLGDLGEGSLRLLDSAGVYGGEHDATLLTYLTQYLNMRKAKDFSLDSAASRQELSGTVNAIMGEMTPEGRVWMQRGAFKYGMQFFAFPWKMFMMLAPGSQQLSLSQKMGIMFSQSFLLGSNAIKSMGKFREFIESQILDTDNFVENDEERAQLREDYAKIKPALDQGVLGAYANLAMRSLSSALNPGVVDDPTYSYTEYDVGGRYGLGASVESPMERLATLSQIAAMALHYQMPEWQDLFETTLGAGPKDIFTYAKRTSKLWGMAIDDSPEVRNQVFATLGKASLEQIGPMMTKYYRMQAQKRYNEEITASGVRNLAFEGTADEWLTTALGIKSLDDVEASRKGWMALAVDEGTKGNQAKQVKEEGDKIYDAIFQLVTKSPKGDEGFSVSEAMLNRHAELTRQMYAMMPEGDVQLTRDYVIRKIDTALKEGSPQDKAIARYIGQIDGLAYDDGGLEEAMKIQRTRAAEYSPKLAMKIDAWLEEYNKTQDKYQ